LFANQISSLGRRHEFKTTVIFNRLYGEDLPPLTELVLPFLPENERELAVKRGERNGER
jgi:hypothetical protein